MRHTSRDVDIPNTVLSKSLAAEYECVEFAGYTRLV